MWSRGIILIALLLTVASCRAPKEKTSVDPVKQKVAELVSKMHAANVEFSGLKGKFSANYTGVDKQHFSLGGFIRINDDSAIWISLSPLAGLEAARALITHDSVKLVNRLNSTYFLGGLEYINTLLQTDLDYDILQALLLGNDVPYYEDDVFKSGVSGNYYHISTLGRRKLKMHVRNDNELERVLIQDIFLDPETFRIRRHDLKQVGQENRKLTAFYDDFRDIDGQWVPHSLRFEITVDGKLEIDVKFSRMSIGPTLGLPFNIPASYTPIQ